MDRKLVITADDLGVDTDTNATIVELMREGLVSATTLIPVAPAAPDAVRRMREAGLGDPRLHLTLSSARELPPWRPLSPDVPSLTGPDGTFPTDPAVVERTAMVPELARELLAQLNWMRGLGLRPTCLDTHSGTLYGLHGRPLAGAAVEFCAVHQLSFRLPRQLSMVLGVAVRGLQTAHRAAVARADYLTVRLPEVLVSSWLPGRMVLSYAQMRAEILAQLRRLPLGTSELIVHPTSRSAARHLLYAEGRKRVWELQLLRDPVFHRTLHREGITIVPAW